MAYKIQLQNAKNAELKNLSQEKYQQDQIKLAKGITELPNFFT